MTNDTNSRWIMMSEALTALAFLDIAKPIEKLMTLLCDGSLSARGSYLFRTYREYQLFESEGNSWDIPTSRWDALRSAMEKTPQRVNLSFLFEEDPQTLTGELDTSQNAFRLASVTGDLFVTDYAESWLSVWNIHVWESELMQAVQGKVPTPISIMREFTNTGGRPPKANWEQALIYLFGKIYREGWKPETIEEVNTELQNWLANEGAEVSDTASRERARALFRALKAWDSAEV